MACSALIQPTECKFINLLFRLISMLIEYKTQALKIQIRHVCFCGLADCSLSTGVKWPCKLLAYWCSCLRFRDWIQTVCSWCSRFCANIAMNVSAGMGEKVRARLQLGAVRLLGEEKVGMHAKSERSSWQSGQVLVKSCAGLPNAAKSLGISETAT